MLFFHRVKEDKKERMEKRFCKIHCCQQILPADISNENISFFAFQGEMGEAGPNVIVSHKCNLCVGAFQVYNFNFLHRAVRENQVPQACLADRCLSLQRYCVVIFWKLIKQARAKQ